MRAEGNHNCRGQAEAEPRQTQQEVRRVFGVASDRGGGMWSATGVLFWVEMGCRYLVGDRQGQQCLLPVPQSVDVATGQSWPVLSLALGGFGRRRVAAAHS